MSDAMTDYRKWRKSELLENMSGLTDEAKKNLSDNFSLEEIEIINGGMLNEKND